MDSSGTTRSSAFFIDKVIYLILAISTLTVSHSASAVIIDGRDWRQPLETSNFSYNHAAAVCNVTTGVCNGAAVNPGQPSVDLTGWIWASENEVADLFRSLLGEPGAVFHPQNGYVGRNGPQWVLDAIDIDGSGPDSGLFDATTLSASLEGVLGITRTVMLNSQQENAASRAIFRHEIANSQGRAIIANPTGFDAARQHTGLWLYKAVPAPSTLLLLLVSLLAITSRRIRN